MYTGRIPNSIATALSAISHSTQCNALSLNITIFSLTDPFEALNRNNNGWQMEYLVADNDEPYFEPYFSIASSEFLTIMYRRLRDSHLKSNVSPTDWDQYREDNHTSISSYNSSLYLLSLMRSETIMVFRYSRIIALDKRYLFHSVREKWFFRTLRVLKTPFSHLVK